jgi:hypothetical protein
MAGDACCFCKALPGGRVPLPPGGGVSMAAIFVLLLLLLAPAWRSAQPAGPAAAWLGDAEPQPVADPVGLPSASPPLPGPTMSPRPLLARASMCPPALFVVGGGGVLGMRTADETTLQRLAAQGPSVGTVGEDLGGVRLPAAQRLGVPQTGLDVRERPLAEPAVVAATPRRCYPASGECACLLEEDACAAGVDTVVVGRDDPRLARYCASPPLPLPLGAASPGPATTTSAATVTDTTASLSSSLSSSGLSTEEAVAAGSSWWRRVDPRWVVLQARGWIANEAVPALSPFYRCTRTMCATTTSRTLTAAAPWPGATNLAADAELLSLDSDKYDVLRKPFAAYVQAILYTESHGRHPLLASPSFGAADKDVRISYKPGGHTELMVSICKYTEAQLRMPGLPLHRKTGLVAWMASHAVPAREQLVQALMAYMPVHSYGPRLHNRNVTQDFPAHCKRPRTGREYYSESECIIYHHKFYLALENDDTDPYYHTEKLYIPLAMGTVPVYWGPRTVHAIAPSNRSVLYVSDYASVADLAHAMLSLANDTEAYDAYRSWKMQAPWPSGFDEVVRRGRPTVLCQLCDWVADRRVRQQHAMLSQVWTHSNTTCLASKSDLGSDGDADRDTTLANGPRLAVVVQLAQNATTDVAVAAACGAAAAWPRVPMVQQGARAPGATAILDDGNALALFVTPADVQAASLGARDRLWLAESLAQLAALVWLTSEATVADKDHAHMLPDVGSWALLLGTAVSAPRPWVAAAHAVLASPHSTPTVAGPEADAPPDMVLIRLRESPDLVPAGRPAPMRWQRCVGNAPHEDAGADKTDGRTPYALLVRRSVAKAMAERGPVHTLADVSLTGLRMCASLNIYTVSATVSGPT